MYVGRIPGIPKSRNIDPILMIFEEYLKLTPRKMFLKNLTPGGMPWQ
jgi:hypothetical protein